jgi:photosystem II stability/assembly factor-like uncharacterized protein
MRLQQLMRVPLLVAAAGLAGVFTLGSTAAAGPATTAPIGALSGVSCLGTTIMSNTQCWAVGDASGTGGGAILTTVNGGRTWTVQLQVSSLSLEKVTCTSASYCWVTGSGSSGPVIYATTDGGKHWTAQTVPKGLGGVTRGNISCSGNSDCWVAGSTAALRPDEAVIATTNGGATWKFQTLPKVSDGMGQYAAISCTSAKDCVFTGIGALTTTDGGAKWMSGTLKGALPFVAVSCSSAKDCAALGYSESAVPTNEAADIVTTTTGGASWVVSVKQVASVGELNGVTCWSGGCVAVGYGYTVTSKGPPANYSFWPAIFAGKSTTTGMSWKRQTGPSTVSALNDVSCASTKDCIAVGSTKSFTLGAILATTDGGTTWTSQQP